LNLQPFDHKAVVLTSRPPSLDRQTSLVCYQRNTPPIVLGLSIKDDRSKGGGSVPSTGCPQTQTNCASEVRTAVLHPPSPRSWRPDRKIFCVSDVFTRIKILKSLEGGGLPKGDVGQWAGGSKKSVFGQTSLIDDPL